MKRTKIIATIGPASEDVGTIKQLVSAGIDVARLNMSHGPITDHKRRIENIRKVSGETAILIDLQGPKIRTGLLKEGHVTLHSGNTFIITTRQVEGDDKLVSTSYKGLTRDVKAGDDILIDDGLIKLKAVKVGRTDVVCRVINGGVLKNHKGLNLPGVRVSAPSLTAKDKRDLLFGIKEKVDYVAISFVREAKDVHTVKNIIRSKGANIPVIAKIEKPEALRNLIEIIKAADGIMIARGDLGVELSPEKVPVIQKDIIKKCNFYAKPVITATQMLETMVTNPRPTRAEASDVANAVYDGTDALMLSEEVAVGKYPVASVRTMSNITNQAESAIYTKEHEVSGLTVNKTVASAVCHAACHTAEELDAKAVIAFTSSGSTALLVSKFKADVPVIAVTTDRCTLRRVKLYFGVIPVLTGSYRTTDQMFGIAEKAMLTSGLVKKSDLVILVAGIPIGRSGTTNLIKVHRIGESVRLAK